ncbi:MAG: hypothetical protein NZ898_14910 [Myxococcota bacterium]|nr:hypothetical protein [Myxococcota bacterium]MDW8363749.1 hypothetical protein [Myxococcales bacterium]
MSHLRRALVPIALGLHAPMLVLAARAQQDPAIAPAESTTQEQAFDAEAAPPDEQEAWELASLGQYVEARERAERIVAVRPDAYVARLAHGWVELFGEGDPARAVFHLERGLRAFEARWGSRPDPRTSPWRWHLLLLRGLVAAHGDLDQHESKLALLDRIHQLYGAHVDAERAWPLMKLRRFDEARAAARAALARDDRAEQEIALNALCAIEFEAGNERASYEACLRALEFGREQPGGPNAVDCTNFAEAALSVFAFDEAEEAALEGTRALVAWYANPWLVLADLYVRQGRLPEALDALRQVPRYRQRRPPHVRDVDRAEGRRILAAFYLAAGRATEALQITEKALLTPDRRAHTSRDPEQDDAVVALLDRAARRLEAERIVERAAARSWWRRPVAHARAAWMRWEGFRSGRRAARALADEARLVGSLRIGTARSAIVPPWLAGDLVHVLGAGVVLEALERARRQERRPGAGAYFDAFEAEARLARGDEDSAVRRARAALDALAPAEALLRARTRAVLAMALLRRDGVRAARAEIEASLAEGPGFARLLGLRIPVRIQTDGSPAAEALAETLARSPRLKHDDEGLALEVRASPDRLVACLRGHSGATLGCGTAEARAREELDEWVARAHEAFHDGVFAPRVDLSQADVGSLDGSVRVSRDPLESLFEAVEPPLELETDEP